MRGPEKSCIVVRRSNGELVIEEKPRGAAARSRILKLPLIRGVYSLVDSLREGMAALNFSASFFDDEEMEEPGRFEKWLYAKFGSEKIEKVMMGAAMVLGCAIPIALFFLLPTLLAGLFNSLNISGVVRNLLEGLIRIIIFLTFMALVSRMKDIKRTFSYHGAEHKTIHCYEKGLELTVPNVRVQPRQHPRCGTSFLFVVMIVSILVFSVVTWTNPWMRMVLRLALLPVVIAISYEINRFAGRHDNWLTKALRAPGIALQRLTTNEPDDSMIEVAIESLKRVIPEEKGADAW